MVTTTDQISEAVSGLHTGADIPFLVTQHRRREGAEERQCVGPTNVSSDYS